MENRKSEQGVSLLSLLITIGLIGVLAALLTTGFGKARTQALSITCMGNLRQIGVALNAYLADHNGRYPPSRANLAYHDDDNPAGVHHQTALKVYLNPYPDSGTITSEMAGPLWCPADLARKNALAYHSYGVNSYIGGYEPIEQQNIRQEQNPSKRLYLLETTRSTLSTGMFGYKTWPFNNGSTLRPDTEVYVDFRHQGMAYGLFLDGRVQGFREADLRGQHPDRM